ncbi:hypothetical protein FACS189491_08020 [Spirochaetia bacterium]|nr:hypothetical protein FACS189491_08020 [Spirochaetia bacterium]
MSQLLFTLPPLSPDYSGVASVFHDLGLLTVIHDASGCTGTYTGYDEPRWFGSSSPVFCSGLREMDAIMGDDEKLLKKIQSALLDTGAPGVVIIGSPVPMVVGFDFKGFASLVENRTGLPAFGFPTTGIAYYDEGQRNAYLAAARRLLAETSPKDPLRVNILGASALDGFDDPALDLLEDLLTGAGFHRGAVWGARSPLEEIKESGGAGLNWVISAAALPLARYFKEHFGIPFITGLPIGKKEEDRILSGLLALHRGAGAEIFPPASEENSKEGCRILITGEALFCSSLRAWLEKEEGETGIRIATFFGEGKPLLHPGDCFFETEDEAVRSFAELKPQTFIGDILFSGLLSGEIQPHFIPVPHRAVSGRFHAEGRSGFFKRQPFQITCIPSPPHVKVNHALSVPGS